MGNSFYSDIIFKICFSKSVPSTSTQYEKCRHWNCAFTVTHAFILQLEVSCVHTMAALPHTASSSSSTAGTKKHNQRQGTATQKTNLSRIPRDALLCYKPLLHTGPSRRAPRKYFISDSAALIHSRQWNIWPKGIRLWRDDRVNAPPTERTDDKCFWDVWSRSHVVNYMDGRLCWQTEFLLHVHLLFCFFFLLLFFCWHLRKKNDARIPCSEPYGGSLLKPRLFPSQWIAELSEQRFLLCWLYTTCDRENLSASPSDKIWKNALWCFISEIICIISSHCAC